MSAAQASSPKPKRSDMPVLSGFLDELKANMGDDLFKGVKVLYAKEGKYEVGKPSKDVGVTPCLDDLALKKHISQVGITKAKRR